MEHWKQQDKGRQQPQRQQQAKSNGPAAAASHHQYSHKALQATTKTTSPLSQHQHNSAKHQQVSDPIKSIASVLNQHSKFVQDQRKAQRQFEEQQAKNKLEQLRGKPLGSAEEQRGIEGRTGRDINIGGDDGTGGGRTHTAAAPSTASFSHSSNQVDQGNSYLYAYNDFITSTPRSTQQQESGNRSHRSPLIRSQASAGDELRTGKSSARAAKSPLFNFDQLANQSQHLSAHRQPHESLIDSDEDDALSYILHQHRAHQANDLVRDQQAPTIGQSYHIDGYLNPSFLQEADENLEDNLEAQRIEHHLSCSRSSHPRHICGIGGSHNDNLNHIAARLREESQKAFALNQKVRAKYPRPDATAHGLLHHGSQLLATSNELASFQSHQFTHDLTIIQDQLTSGSSQITANDNDEQANDSNESEAALEADSSYLNLNLNNELHLARSSVARVEGVALASGRGGAKLASAGRRADSELEIVNDSNSNSNSDLSRPTTLTGAPAQEHQHLHPTSARRDNRGYLSWLLCCLCNLFGLSRRSSPIKQQARSHYDRNILNVVGGQKRRGNKKRRGKKGFSSYNSSGDGLHASEASIVTMYSGSQQQQLGAALGQLGGQAGAYYPTQAAGPQSAQAASGEHALTSHHPHQTFANHAHHHHYPLSSDSSLGSSGFATSALRMNAFFKSCCSKKCLFVSCLLLILLIFIFVIGLSAYLNYLINLNKTNLTPLSGRLRVESQGDSFSDQLANRTSREFLAKQQQYETILRGAFDRTQNLLKTYPNHLVKCEVYSFKPGSLWVYFRLFINKRTLLHDTQLMKRKSPDEHLDRQFLPRLTQQTLHSGFEQLAAAFNRNLSLQTGDSERRASRSSATADPSRQPRFAQSSEKLRNLVAAQRDHVISFDDQISRLMPIIESIDLQSIEVTPEFDMLQSVGAAQANQQQLRASQIPTTSATMLVATGNTDKSLAEYDISSSSSTSPDGQVDNINSTAPSLPTALRPTLQPAAGAETTTQSGRSDEVNVTTKKFTIHKWENETRPTTSSRPRSEQTESGSLFLVNQSRKPLLSEAPPSPARGATSNEFAAEFGAVGSVSNSTGFRPLISLTRPAEQQANVSKVVKLKSGQPVVSQNNNLQRPAAVQSAGAVDKLGGNRTLFIQFPKMDQFAGSNSTVTSAFDYDLANSGSSGGLYKSRGANETVVIPIIAPYQKNDFSTTRATQDDVVSPSSAIEELWNKALSSSNRKNSTSKLESLPKQSSGDEQPKRLITITRTGGWHKQNFSSNNPFNGLDWHNVSVFSPEISDTIRAQLQNASTTLSPVPAATVTASHPKRPKVSPHLKQGGSLISNPVKQQEYPGSSIVLNKDFEQGNASNSTQAKLSQIRSEKPDKRPSVSGIDGQRNSFGETQRKNLVKPIIRPVQSTTPKSKKVAESIYQQISARNESSAIRLAPNGTSASNNRGIKIVDNFLASLENNNKTSSAAQQQAISTTRQPLNHNISSSINKNRTLEPFNYNADFLVPTLPTTIELTRSTTSAPPSRTTHSANADYTTTSSAPQRYLASTSVLATESPFKAIQAPPTHNNGQPSRVQSNVYQAFDRHEPKAADNSNQQAGSRLTATQTTNFSNQWKPISNQTVSVLEVINPQISVAQAKNKTISTRGPNSGSERLQLPPTSNVPSNSGSQSPFAMSTSILESIPNKLNTVVRSEMLHPKAGRRNIGDRVSNSYQIVGSASSTSASGSSSKEFESHRMSRMRQSEHPFPMEVFGPTQAIPSSTSSSLESSTRVVDGFVIATDKIDAGISSSMPPMFLNSFQPNQHSFATRARQAPNPLDLVPKRTRGPFAFETLKSLAISDQSLDAGKLATGMSSIQSPGQRLERSPSRQGGRGSESNLLMKKKLFLGTEEDEDTVALAASPPPELASVMGSNQSGKAELVGSGLNKTDAANLVVSESSKLQPANNRQGSLTSAETNHQDFAGNQSFKCQYYGCRAKGSDKYICLNYTQICDDFIDCYDESDELDCVSLLKYDSKTNRLSFSNGGGIIYLNRKGSLAPMCIDYFTQTDNITAANSAHESDIAAGRSDSSKKQQELIKQINTIGQYACSLQSFSRLVSVKINHHDLVDSLNSIKTSKLYHRLSIVGTADKSDGGYDVPYGSYKSGNSELEVEVSTSLDCPSQRTVFVKCGDFECGQDSFSVIDSNDVNSTRRKDGVIINDFPWLVKLHWLGSLSCHGYLIDEMWLITSSECFVNKSLATHDLNGWTAEISYEHYGNDDYQSIESNRRGIKEILVQPTNNGNIKPAIVLAKLEKPVRFSPLNRPICLPLSVNKTHALDRVYKDCVTATLPLANSPTHDLLLSKVKFHKTSDCLSGGDQAIRSHQADDLICLSETLRSDDVSRTREDDTTRVLICSSSQSNRLRSKWTVVGVQNKAQGSLIDSNRQLFTTVSSQIEWIVDTMNPKTYPNLSLEGINGSKGSEVNELNPISTLASQAQTCNRFKCSSGECLPWSRICDGLYDCSSHEDEKDCHK